MVLYYFITIATRPEGDAKTILANQDRGAYTIFSSMWEKNSGIELTKTVFRQILEGILNMLVVYMVLHSFLTPHLIVNAQSKIIIKDLSAIIAAY